MTEDVLIKLAAIIVVGVGAQWLAWRFRLPSILLLLVAGIIIGPITEFVNPDELLGDLLIPVVSLSVGLILFEGGLTLRFRDLPGVAGVIRNLITVGAAITWLIGALAAWALFDISLSLAILFGAIIIVTGPTVIGPLLDHVRPGGRVGPVLRWEGIIIDPIGAVLAVLVFEAILQDQLEEAAIDTIRAVAVTFVAGAAHGRAGAAVMVLVMRRYWIPDSLQNPVTLMLVLAAVTASDEVQEESGLLAATIMGIALANQRFVNVRHIVEFKENLRVLIIGGLFVILAARLTTDDITDVGLERIALLAVLILIARPLAVAVSTARSALDWKERAFLASMAPRGIVAAAIASVFALRLTEEGNEQAPVLVPLAFTVIVGTIAVYGLAATPIARWLGLSHANPQGILFIGGQQWARRIAKALHDQEVPILIVDSNRRNINDARMEGLPAYFGNILADYAIDEIDLTGLGRIASMTPNDEVNALAGQRFVPVFGRANVYQLPLRGEDDGRGAAVSSEQRGRILFGKGRNYGYLTQRFAAGAVVKTTDITEEFTYNDFLARYDRARARLGDRTEEAPPAEAAAPGPAPATPARAVADVVLPTAAPEPEPATPEDSASVIPLFLITADKQVRVFSDEGNPTPRPGQTVISILDEPEEHSAERLERKREEKAARAEEAEQPATPA
jgi:NhaP-type Na+/H+ or K+/H+ antiporter